LFCRRNQFILFFTSHNQSQSCKELHSCSFGVSLT
jgi:hypothetical protein